MLFMKNNETKTNGGNDSTSCQLTSAAAENKAYLTRNEKRLSEAQQKEFNGRCEDIKGLLVSTEESLWLLADKVLATRTWYIDALGIETNGGESPRAAVAKANKALAVTLGVTTQRIGQYAETAKFFDPPNRVLEASFFTHEEARKVNATTLETHRRSTAEEIAAAMRAGARDTREITKWIKDRQSQQIAETYRKVSVEWQPKFKGLVNVPHPCRWEEIAVRLLDRTINGFVWADPPFGAFSRDETRFVEDCGGTYMTKADNMEADAALATTLKLFEILPPKLANNDVPLFIMQDGKGVDDPRLIEAARKNGWYPKVPLTWVKTDDPSNKKLAPTSSQMSWAHGNVTQRILVLTLNDRPLPRIGTDLNPNVFFHPNIAHAAAMKIARGLARKEDHHGFEHPWELVAAVVKTVLPRNSKQVIFEPFGCSASACVAAIKNGWDWIYSESYPQNFELGQRRLAEALKVAGTVIPSQETKMEPPA